MRKVNPKLSAAIVAVLYASTGYAQQPPAEGRSAAELETVVVTGSYIRGTPEDAALPVDVISADDLAEQGSPTVVQLVKTITASQSAIGESNRYNGGAGTASINLRGFGANRTLTLFNGRRLADSPLASFQGGGANLNFIPTAAIGRVELLKDGAAATYGSDAIGGVVNFITRRDLDGLEVDAEYSYISDSDGDYQGNVAWGSMFDNGNVLLTFGYRHRSRLDIRDRDWALAPFEDIGYGGWSGAGNPGFYVANTVAGAAIFRDNGCSELGGQLTTGALGLPTTSTALTSVCRYQFSNFNDLVNKEEHYQAHGEFNVDLGGNVKSHTEFTWARDWVPIQRLSPANLSTQFPTPQSLGGTSGSTATPGAFNFFVRYNVPAYHPGLIDLYTACEAPFTGAQCTAMQAAGGVDVSQTAWRAIAHAGHPTNPDKADHQSVENKAFRFSSSLAGDTDWFNWDVAGTYMNARATVNTNDLLVNRIQNGLNGFLSLPGSSNPCDADDITALNAQAPGAARTADHAARGCYFFNPFTNSVEVSAVNGQVNPYYRGNVNPAVINDPAIVESLYGNYVNEFTNELFVVDAVLSGEFGFSMWGGEPGWAFGGQYRYTRDRSEYGDLFNNEITRCVDSIDDGTPICGLNNGPFIFFGSNANSVVSRGVYGVFAELSLPILDSLSIGLAGRYESYPGNIGSTTDPKISIRYEPLDWLVLRGSASTTFRAPGAGGVNPGCTTGVANISGQYRAVETCGNPDLKPETADAYNAGIIFKPGNFTASVDWFYFDFAGELTAESAARLLATMFPGGSNVNCGTAAFAALEARFAFTNAGCGITNVLRIQTFTVNGPSTKTSGFDVRLQYDFPTLLGGSAAIGAEATILKDFRRGEFALNNAPSIVFAAPEDRAGRHDLVSQFFSYPEIRGNAFASYMLSDWTFRLQTRFTEGTEGAFGTPLNRWVFDGTTYAQQPIGKTDDFWQHDLIVRWNAPWDTTLTASVQNILDEDPADAPSQYNYDYTNGNPLGRVFEMSVKKKF